MPGAGDTLVGKDCYFKRLYRHQECMRVSVCACVCACVHMCVYEQLCEGDGSRREKNVSSLSSGDKRLAPASGCYHVLAWRPWVGDIPSPGLLLPSAKQVATGLSPRICCEDRAEGGSACVQGRTAGVQEALAIARASPSPCSELGVGKLGTTCSLNLSPAH